MQKKGFFIIIILFLVILTPFSYAETIHSISKKIIEIPEERITHKEAQIEQEQQLQRSISSGNSYFYLGNQLVASSNEEGMKYYVHDRLGSVRYVLNENGEVESELVYKPFGSKVKGDTKYSYTGKEEDNTGLYYFNARYYDDELGRFLQVDPKYGDNSPYVYVDNNPYKFIDPSGEQYYCPGCGLTYAGINIASGGLIAGIGSKIHGNGFWEGFKQGAFGGALAYSGKALAQNTHIPSMPFAGRIIHSYGVSGIENVASGRNFGSSFRTDLGIFEMEIDEEADLNFRVLPASVMGLTHRISEGQKFDLKRTLSTGTLTFRFDEPEAPYSGYTMGNIVSLNENYRYWIYGHEITHSMQFREKRIFDNVVDGWLSGRGPLPDYRSSASSNAGYLGLHAIDKAFVPYYSRYGELEAMWGYPGRFKGPDERNLFD